MRRVGGGSTIHQLLYKVLYIVGLGIQAMQGIETQVVMPGRGTHFLTAKSLDVLWALPGSCSQGDRSCRRSRIARSCAACGSRRGRGDGRLCCAVAAVQCKSTLHWSMIPMQGEVLQE